MMTRVYTLSLNLTAIRDLPKNLVWSGCLCLFSLPRLKKSTDSIRLTSRQKKSDIDSNDPKIMFIVD